MVPFVTSQRADFHKPKKEKMDLCHFSAGHTEDNFIDDAAGITLKTSQTATFTQWTDVHMKCMDNSVRATHVGVEGA